MSALLGQPFFDLLADTFKQHPIRVGQPEVNRVDTSQDGAEFDEQGAEFPVHVGHRCKVRANPDDFDDIDDGDCWQCGGEGFVASCQDEIGCVDPESGCDLCTYRCDVCKPRTPNT